MIKLVFLTLFISSTSFAQVRYPIGLAISPDGNTMAERGSDRNLQKDVIEVSGNHTVLLQGGENQYGFSDHGNVQFLSPDRLLVTKFNGSWFKVINLNTNLVDCDVPMSSHESGNAVGLRDGQIVAVATSNEVGIYDANTCKKIAGTVSMSDGSPYSVGWIQTLGGDQSNFYFRARQKISGEWNDVIFTYTLSANHLSSRIVNLTADNAFSFESAQLRPGTTEAWFYASDSEQKIKVLDVKTGQLIKERPNEFRDNYSQASDIQFSSDGSKFAIATGWNVGIFDVTDESKDEIFYQVGCKVLNPNFCTSWDGMTVFFNPLDRKLIFAGDETLGTITY